MRQLLQNLVANAIKFRREGEAPSVRVRAAVDAGARECVLTVEDDGIGFEPEYAERIFGIFQRLHGRTAYEGAGIGLAVCRRIAERHGGRITAAGSAGAGARFTVTLPLHHRTAET
jgi:signal transduction histidine kinase